MNFLQITRLPFFCQGIKSSCPVFLPPFPFQAKSNLVARGQGPSGQKASAGLALSLEASTDFRKMRRADRATARSPLQGEYTFIGGLERLARQVHEMEAASWFLPGRSLPPGLAPARRQSMALTISLYLERKTEYPLFTGSE